VHGVEPPLPADVIVFLAPDRNPCFLKAIDRHTAAKLESDASIPRVK
jgi:hypothetical protein